MRLCSYNHKLHETCLDPGPHQTAIKGTAGSARKTRTGVFHGAENLCPALLTVVPRRLLKYSGGQCPRLTATGSAKHTLRRQTLQNATACCIQAGGANCKTTLQVPLHISTFNFIKLDTHTAIRETDHQQGPTVQHGELCTVGRGSLHGGADTHALLCPLPSTRNPHNTVSQQSFLGTSSVTYDSLRLHGLEPTRLFCPCDFPGKNTEASCHSLFQWILLIQGLKLCLLHCRRILYPLSHQGSPLISYQFSSVTQSGSTLCDPVDCSTPGFLSVTSSRSLLKLTSIESLMPSNHLILCRPILLLPSIFPSIRVFSNMSVLRIRWPKYWSFSFSISPSSDYSGLISFRIHWVDLLAVQEVLKSLLQQHNSKASALRYSAFFMVQLSHPYVTTGKTIALTRRTFVSKVMSLLFNMLSRLVMPFLLRSKSLLISWLQSPSAVILEPKKIKPITVCTISNTQIQNKTFYN